MSDEFSKYREMDESQGLKRKLGAFDAAMIVSGAIIGAGIFINPAESAKFLQSSSQLLLVWGAGGLIAFLGALCFAELGAMFPETGGQVVYLEKAFSPWLGFLFGWTLFSTIQTGAIAAVSYTCASFISYFMPLSRIGVSVLAAAIIWLLSLVNLLGIRPGSVVQNIFTFLKIAALLSLIGFGLFWYKSGPAAWGPLFPEGLDWRLLSAFGLALMPALFSYGGWQNLNFVAGEVTRPTRNIPIAIISGVSLVVFVYIFSNIVYARALPLAAIAASPRLASDAMKAMAGSWGAGFISLAIIVSTFGITNVFVMTGPRVYFTMARERMFVPLAARLHPRFGTPHFSIILQSLWATVLLGTNSYGQLLRYVTFGDWIFFGLAALALVVLRKKRPELERPYRTWGYPVVPVLFVAISAAVVLNVMVSSPVESAIGSAIILGGWPIYAICRRTERKRTV